MYHIKKFMRERIYEKPTGKNTVMPPIINTKFPATMDFYVPYCESCVLDRPKKISTGTAKVNTLPEKE